MTMRTLIYSGALALLIATPVLADKGGVSHSAPGPLIGVGLPGLAAYGLYVWFRRRQRGG